MVLENEKNALARGARIYATLAGYGSANDAHHITSPSPDGFGLSQSIYKALEDASLTPSDIQCINAHGSSTPLNDSLEGCVISNIFGDYPWVTSTKGVTGHSLAATGAMEAVFSVLTMLNDEIPPVAGLQNVDEAIKVNIAAGIIRGAGIKIYSAHPLDLAGKILRLFFPNTVEGK